MKIWIVRLATLGIDHPAENQKAIEYGIRNNLFFIGWRLDMDYVETPDHYIRSYCDVYSPKDIESLRYSMNRFCIEEYEQYMEKGDLCITRSGNDVYIGEVQSLHSSYASATDFPEAAQYGFSWYRKVTWKRIGMIEDVSKEIAKTVPKRPLKPISVRNLKKESSSLYCECIRAYYQ